VEWSAAIGETHRTLHEQTCAPSVARNTRTCHDRVSTCQKDADVRDVHTARTHHMDMRCCSNLAAQIDHDAGCCDLVCSRRAAVHRLLLTCATLSLVACDAGSTDVLELTNAVTVSGSSLHIALARLNALRTPGSAYVLREHSVIVIRVAERDYRAFTNICTHAGCGVSLFENDRMRCPCHGSEFGIDGGSLTGPALLPLRRFEVSLDVATMTLTITK
jgi:nitrite reductase/ring-hydroxylating ferredoxin subunit